MPKNKTVFSRVMGSYDRFIRLLSGHNYVRVASYSGKGGTGKSLTANNVAIRFEKAGLRVGLLDIDLEMSSLISAMGLGGKTAKRDKSKRRIIPEINSDYPNLKMFSMDLMPYIAEGESVFWAGEHKREYIFQCINEVDWGKLDVMVFDMPAGISDALIALKKSYRTLDYAVISAQNSETSLRGAIKAMTTCRENGIEVAGVISNMAYCDCPECGHRFHPLGKPSSVQNACKKYDVKYLGEVPLAGSISAAMESGNPYIESTTYDLMVSEIIRRERRLRKHVRS